MAAAITVNTVSLSRSGFIRSSLRMSCSPEYMISQAGSGRDQVNRGL
jgi:hypothetical protein